MPALPHPGPSSDPHPAFGHPTHEPPGGWIDFQRLTKGRFRGTNRGFPSVDSFHEPRGGGTRLCEPQRAAISQVAAAHRAALRSRCRVQGRKAQDFGSRNSPSVAALSQRRMASSAVRIAFRRVAPWAMQSGSSGLPRQGVVVVTPPAPLGVAESLLPAGNQCPVRHRPITGRVPDRTSGRSRCSCR